MTPTESVLLLFLCLSLVYNVILAIRISRMIERYSFKYRELIDLVVNRSALNATEKPSTGEKRR